MRIGVVAPAGPIDAAAFPLAEGFAAIAFPEVELVIHPQCFLADGHFAGPDGVRAAAFLEVANDPAIDAIWFARGGYGANRLLAEVMPHLGEAARAKTYLGYSDVGFFLGALYARRIGRPVHGPMITDGRRKVGGDGCLARSLGWLAAKDRAGLEPSLAMDRHPAAAFNLSILTAMIGTPWLPDLADHVLMIEDVGEAMYRIDRMLFQMAHASQLKGLAGVRLGRITDVVPNTPAWNIPVEAMIERWCKEMAVPWLGPADIAHDAANKVVPFGLA